MSSPQTWIGIKALPAGPRRRKAVRRWLAERRGVQVRVAQAAAVHQSMVSKVLHGAAVSARVAQAIEAEEAGR